MVRFPLGRGLSSLIPSNQPDEYGARINADDKTRINTDIPTRINADAAAQINANHRELIRENQTDNPRESALPDKPEAIFYIELHKIRKNSNQPRKNFDPESLKELADSIREYGILEPLILSRQEEETFNGSTVYYELIAGERRLKAAEMAGLKTVPARIRQLDSAFKKLEMALIENIQREDLNPVEQARAFAKLIDEFGLVQRELAQKIGKSREVIANSLRLLQLPFEAQKALESGIISESHARVLLMVENKEKQRALLEEIKSKNITVRELENLVKKLLSPAGLEIGKEKRFTDAEMLDLKRKLEDLFGIPIIISKLKGGGKLVIKFKEMKEIDDLIKKLIGRN